MSPERWREVERILEQALQREPAARAAFLDEACGHDPALRQEVESLLGADLSATGFLEPPVPSASTPAGSQGSLARSDLAERLQKGLGAAYVIERELGGGGMSRVFVAEETALGRQVVVKVLPPELAAGLDAERFHREIHLAASLQHPHIVPVHSAGQAHGLLYYTMPYVKGESLKQRLERDGALPVGEAIRLLREVTDALCYAHRRGIIHRDLKPANILLEEGHALVIDFGIAKALVAATGSGGTGPSLTATGFVLGTPSYMAPEQAAGEETDHRADLYALGCLAYELLTGHPPFAGASAQALIAAHIAEVPAPVTSRRPGLPRELNQLVLRLLEKRPAVRPQSADEVLRDLDSLSLPVSRTPLVAILGIYLACAIAVFGLAYVAMMQLGLPDWVIPGAAILLLIGLPIILATGLLQRGHVGKVRRGARGSGSLPPHWLTWHRAISGGMLAFAGLGVVVTAYMAMRALGIKPVGTLLAAGVLREREPVLLADFDNRTRDSLLGSAVTEAFRIDLMQSPVVRVVPVEQVAEVLSRMRRPADVRLDQALAREVAVRDNIRVVVAGEIARAGTQYVLSARLVAPRSGEVLAAQRETAPDSTKIIGAVDRLSKKLRGKIGESLKSLRAEQPLEQATTTSLEALRKFTQAVRTASLEGANDRVITLLEEAVALDTGFASAYRSLGLNLYYRGVTGRDRDRALRALTQAYEHRDRLTDRERYRTVATYYQVVDYQPEKVATAYRALLDIYPDDKASLGNLAALYLEMRQDGPAEEILRRVVASNSAGWSEYVNLATAQVGLGKWHEAQVTMDRAAKQFPDNPYVESHASLLASAQGDYRSAEAHARAIQERGGEDPQARSLSGYTLAQIAALQGKLKEAERYAREWMETDAQNQNNAGYLSGAAFLGTLDAWFRHAPARGIKIVEEALSRSPLDSLQPLERPYIELASFYALAGKPQRARMLIGEYERAVDPALRREAEMDRHAALGDVALAEGRPWDAVVEFRATASLGLWCTVCGLSELGRAYQAAGEPDSAIAAYERYIGTRSKDRLDWDALELAGVYRNLGELYEARGNREDALSYYSRFVDLWKSCDQELKPQVVEVKRRLAELSKEV